MLSYGGGELGEVLLPSRARVDLRVWLERLGMCGCMNLFLISHTFLDAIFPCAPP